MDAVITLAGRIAIRTTDGRELQLHDRRARIAFVRLVLDGSNGTPPDRLADTVWPDCLPKTWESALRTVVSRVRSFAQAALPTGGCRLALLEGRYVLELPSETTVDVELAEWAVEAGEQALVNGDLAVAGDLCVGAMRHLRAPLLADYESEWINEWRERRAQLAVVALETISMAASQIGKPAAALAAANEAVNLAPLRESAHRCRMMAHATAGNSAEALRSYERLRRLLADELGVGPDPETERLYLRLLTS